MSGLEPNKKLTNEEQLVYELEKGAKNCTMRSSFVAICSSPLAPSALLEISLVLLASPAEGSHGLDNSDSLQSLQASASEKILGNGELEMGCAVVVSNIEFIIGRDKC